MKSRLLFALIFSSFVSDQCEAIRVRSHPKDRHGCYRPSLASRSHRTLEYHIIQHSLKVVMEYARFNQWIVVQASLAGDRCRSETLGRENRSGQHFAHLGTKPFAASLHSLRHSCGRKIATSWSLDPPSVSFLPAREDPQPRLSWKLSGRSEKPLLR